MTNLHRGTQTENKSTNLISKPITTFLYQFYTSNILSISNRQIFNISLR